MKKLIILAILTGSLSANQCNYNFKQLHSYINQNKKARQLGINTDRIKRMMFHYTDQVLLTCPEQGDKFKLGLKIKKVLDKYKKAKGL